MKTKILNLVLLLCCIVPAVFVLSACSAGGSAHSHTFRENPDDRFIKTQATCTESAIYYKSCACGEKSTETFEFGDPMGHEYVYTSLGDGTHFKECIYDPTHSAYERCTGTATCYERACCEFCYDYFGETIQHSFVIQKATPQYLKSEATCLAAAQYFYSCANCGAKGDKSFTYGTSCGHKFGHYYSNGDAT